jgi:hypothetical protein
MAAIRLKQAAAILFLRSLLRRMLMQRNDAMARRDFLRLGILAVGSGFLFAACGKILG